tara:strand:- start:617 stop:1396 length:780 start_codon:yes stop_codon:yes gene_type:complete
MYYYDLETCFLAKGHKRTEQQILEVGICKGRKSFSALVDPTLGNPIISSLEHMGQHPERSIKFWTKLLIGKGLLNSAVKRKPYEEQAKYIDAIRSDFITPEAAIKGMIAFGTGTWVAHNGKAFDQKIIEGHLERFSLTPKIDFKDSLPEIRKLKLPSASLGFVYKHLFKHPFKAHHALDDAFALQRVCKKLGIHEVFAGPAKTPLTTLKGIGPKTEAVLIKAGVSSVEELKEWFTTNAKWSFKTHRNLYSVLLAQIKVM